VYKKARHHPIQNTHVVTEHALAEFLGHTINYSTQEKSNSSRWWYREILGVSEREVQCGLAN